MEVNAGKPRRWRWVLRFSLSALLALAGGIALRVMHLAARREAALQVITLPTQSTRWINSIVSERLGAILAAEALHLPKQHGDDLADVLRASYDRMDRSIGDVPTPAIATYLGMQSPSSFDLVVIEPPAHEKPTSALIFLHGYAGNFNVYCWQVSQAAAATNTLVVCPSVGPRGDWWTPHGLTTVRRTLSYVHDRGIRHVFLGGLSNGATGAGVLAPHLTHELDGIVLISGAPANVGPTALPLFVIQGEHDTMMPAWLARRYATAAPGPRRYVSLDGGHFVVLSQWQTVTAALSKWLEVRLAGTLRPRTHDPPVR